MTELATALIAAIPDETFDVSSVDPDWDMACFDSDWARWIPNEIRGAWPSLSLESKLVAVALAMEIAAIKSSSARYD